jgi:hypothetical protein
MTLNEIMNASGSDKGDQIGAKHNYVPIYEKLFENYRDSEVKFMEVGIDSGQSLKAWQTYFTKAKIYMVDYNNFSHLNTDRVTCFQANQSKMEDMIRVSNQVADLDFFIDDGGHCMDHQQLTFGAIFPKMKSGGLFFIEDTHTSNWDPSIHPLTSPGYCYGQPVMINEDRSSTTINTFKRFQRTKLLDSIFLSDHLNNSLRDMIDEVIIYGDNNEEIPIDSDLENTVINHGVILIKRK